MDKFFRSQFEHGMLVHVGGKVQEDANTEHARGEPDQPYRCLDRCTPIEEPGIDDPGRCPVQGETEPHIEPVPDRCILFPGLVREDPTFKYPEDPIGPVQGQIGPGCHTLPGAIGLHEHQDIESCGSLVNIDEMSFFELHVHLIGLIRSASFDRSDRRPEPVFVIS